MVAHPPGLESCILPIIGEDEQATALGMLHHILSQHMNICDISSSNRSAWLPKPAGNLPSISPTAYTPSQIPDALFALLYRKHRQKGLQTSTGKTTRLLFSMSSSTLSTHKEPR